MLEKGEKTGTAVSLRLASLRAAHSADEREHRRPQVEKRKATTIQESTPIEDGWRIAPRQIKNAVKTIVLKQRSLICRKVVSGNMF